MSKEDNVLGNILGSVGDILNGIFSDIKINVQVNVDSDKGVTGSVNLAPRTVNVSDTVKEKSVTESEEVSINNPKKPVAPEAPVTKPLSAEDEVSIKNTKVPNSSVSKPIEKAVDDAQKVQTEAENVVTKEPSDTTEKIKIDPLEDLSEDYVWQNH